MKIITLLLAGSLVFGAIINVEDGTAIETIQEGINLAQTGDTVLVAQGNYSENLFLDKEITLASRAIYDDLTNWHANANIMNTVIDGGSAPLLSPFGSCILIYPADDGFGNLVSISPIIMGFTIQNGIGTRVIENLDPDYPALVHHLRVGGGFMAYGTLPKLNYNRIINNGTGRPAIFVDKGAGGYTGTDVDIDELRLRNHDFSPTRSDTLDYSHNLFLNNNARIGKTLVINENDVFVKLNGSHFDVLNCIDNLVTQFWIVANPGIEINFNGCSSNFCSIYDDIWVSPIGDDLTGDGTQLSPFKTINHALGLIVGTFAHPVKIILDPGMYSPSLTGEQFPLNLMNHVGISGDPMGVSILDAESSGAVMRFRNVGMSFIESIVITGGLEENWSGGGVFMSNSNPFFLNVTIIENSAEIGGAIFGFNSSIILANTIVWGNTTPQIFMLGTRFPNEIVIVHSDIESGMDGIEQNETGVIHWLAGNIDADPQLTSDFCLMETSPCIDAGVENTQFIYNGGQNELFIPPLFFSGAAPDIGGCESGLFGLPGDLDENGAVDVVDIVILVDIIFGTVPTDHQFWAGDLNFDGVLNVVDIVQLVDIILFD